MSVGARLLTALGGVHLFHRHPSLRLVEAGDRALTLLRFEGARDRRIRVVPHLGASGAVDTCTVLSLKGLVEVERRTGVRVDDLAATVDRLIQGA